MNLERLRWGEWIAAIAALDLLLVTFRAWYKVSGGDGRVTAWDGLDNGRYLLIATAVVGIFLFLIQAAEDTQQLSFPPGWLAAAVGFACTVYAAYRLASPPSDNLDPDLGLYLGLVSALGVTVGGLLSAREAAPSLSGTETEERAHTDPFAAPSAPAAGDAGTWSPAAPVAASTGWSPAAPVASVPPATTAGALGGERPLQSGDSVVLTAGGARFPAGTVAEVVDVFAGGALVEVKAPDGMAERFEVPESAYERTPAGGAAAGGESWSPAMPAAAGDDWGFDDPAAAAAAPGDRTATGTVEPPAEQAAEKKTPWWKREIGGGKKKDDEGARLAAAAGLGAAGGAALESATANGAGDEKPGFFKRLFGGGGKDEPAAETVEQEPTPTSGVAGIGEAAESDTAVDEASPEAAAPAPYSEPEAATPAPDPQPEAPATEPEAIAPASDPEPGPIAPVPDPEPQSGAPAPEPEATAPAPDPEPDPEPAASEPLSAAPDPEPPASAPEPEVAPEPEPPAAPEPEAVASEEPPAAPAAGEPDQAGGGPDLSDIGAAGAGAAAGAAASAAGDDEEPKPKRRRSSGSRKVPKEVLGAADAAQPKVGDEVQLKVGGGKFDAGTKGTVVDVFSAGVIVELSDDQGRTERLDLPFEAIGPADA